MEESYSFSNDTSLGFYWLPVCASLFTHKVIYLAFIFRSHEQGQAGRFIMVSSLNTVLYGTQRHSLLI